MFANLRLTCALAILTLPSLVKPAKQPVQELFVDADLFDAIEYVLVPE